MKTELIFKFRNLSTAKQLAHAIDSINNNRIYLPDYKGLNDPLESSGYIMNLSGYAGISMTRVVDEEDMFVSQERGKYRILSITDNCFSPSMWAHYTNGFHGLCIGYWKRGVFSAAKRMTYTEKAICTSECFIDGPEQLEKEVYNSFFYKHSDWSYENEWRIVKKQEEKYLNYSGNEIACIIFGGNLSQDIIDSIVKGINKNVVMYRTKIGYRTFGINLLPYDYKIEMTGEEPPFIRNVDELKDQIIGQNTDLIYNEQEEYFRRFSKKLIEVFGKDTFMEEELTKEFYVELKIKCSEFFVTDDDCFDLDLFWSEEIKEWLLSPKH